MGSLAALFLRRPGQMWPVLKCSFQTRLLIYAQYTSVLELESASNLTLAPAGWWLPSLGSHPACSTAEAVPGRGEDQHRRAVRARRGSMPRLAQPLGARQQVSQGFAAARLRDRLHVPARQAGRPTPVLGTTLVSPSGQQPVARLQMYILQELLVFARLHCQSGTVYNLIEG